MPDDAQLLRLYAEERSEAAFAELVRRHLDLVYSAALRQVGGDAHRAHDVAQTVFTVLARKADAVARHPVLVGWLYTSTQHAAAKVRRSEARRRAREHEAQLMSEVASEDSLAVEWEKLSPLLDEAMRELNERDREAVLLRFFARRPFAEIGATLRVSEDAARMRVERALEKLRAVLARRGVTSTGAALGVVLANQAVMAAPAGLAGTVAAGVSLGGVGVGASVWAFMGTAKTMGSAVAVLLLVGLGLAIYEVRRATARELDESRARLAAAERRAQVAEQSAPEAAARMASPQKELVARQPPAVASARGVSVAAVAESASRRPPVNNPAVQKEKEQLHRRYDPFLLQQRGLTPAQADRFVELKLLKAMDREDFQAAVVSQGLNGRSDEVMALRGKLGAPLDREMREILGDEGMSALNDYEFLSANLISFVEPLRPALEAVGMPLTKEQGIRLARIVEANTAHYEINSTDIGSRARYDWDLIIMQANAVLSPLQTEVFRARVEKLRQALK